MGVKTLFFSQIRRGIFGNPFAPTSVMQQSVAYVHYCTSKANYRVLVCRCPKGDGGLQLDFRWRVARTLFATLACRATCGYGKTGLPPLPLEPFSFLAEVIIVREILRKHAATQRTSSQHINSTRDGGRGLSEPDRCVASRP